MLLRPDAEPIYIFFDDRIIYAVNEMIAFILCLGDSELARDVLVKVIFVPVQMIGGDICEDGDLRLEIIASVQLKATDLQDKEVPILSGNLSGKTETHVSGNGNVQSGLF